MKKRNGSGSRRLAEMTTKFQKSQHRLLEALQRKGMVAPGETKRLSNAVDRAVAQKRSSDVLSTASLIHNRILQSLERAIDDTPEQREAREIELLMSLSAAVQSVADDTAFFDRMIGLVQRAVAHENATLFLVDREEGRLEPVATHGHRVDLIDDVRFELGSGLSAWVAKKKKPILISELGRVGRSGGPVVRSFLSVPLVVQGELIGVLNLSHSRARAFGDDDVRVLGLLAAIAAASLQRTLMKRELKRQTVTDRLTGLYTRRHFQERLAAEVLRARRTQDPFSLLLLDVDGLEAFNGRYGHSAGDRVLVEISRVLQRSCRSSDILARYGGEEFVVLMPATRPEEAVVTAERVRQCVEAHSFPQKRRITVSLGTASCPDDAESDLDLIAKAEQALFLAKRGGRNRAMAFQAVAVH